MTPAMQPDYSRQILLKEIGTDGQARLAHSRVLVVGAGGLGSPVLQYLAGAGIGCLGLVDGDTLDASNLHRQPIYALADTGKSKVELARAAIAQINPTVRVETHAHRFTAGNALELTGRYDLVVDCSDNFLTKFLINDAAVLTQRPAVFASVYQYEGQLQVYEPRASHACLRCLWPQATADGIVGNCAAAGVLGPVPGAFGALQALLTLKVLLGMSGQLDGELLLLDFMNFSSTKLKAPRRSACAAPGCELIHEMPHDDTDVSGADLEIGLPSPAAAAALGFDVIDIRTDAEVAVQPAPGPVRHIAMPNLLANPALLGSSAPRAHPTPPTTPTALTPAAPRTNPTPPAPAAPPPNPPARVPATRYLLLCASGKRSLAAARELHKQGYAVRSLAGGLNAWGATNASGTARKPSNTVNPLDIPPT